MTSRMIGGKLFTALVIVCLVPPCLAGGARAPSATSGEDAYPTNLWTRRWSPSDSTEQRWEVPCSQQYEEGDTGLIAGCHPERCGRAVFDNFISKAEVQQLREIVAAGMTYASNEAQLGGPSIMDINSGFIKFPDGMANMYKPEDKKPKATFSAAQYELYRTVMERIRLQVAKEFQAGQLFLTAPTFVTREVGNSSWQPKEMHDVYWHPHVDKNNTAHYDYSGLLYLADHDDEFTGGKFAFLDGAEDFVQAPPCLDQDIKAMGAPHTCAEYAKAGYCKNKAGKPSQIAMTCAKSCKNCAEDGSDSGAPPMGTQHTVEPMAGRLVVFTSGRENLHQVKKVLSGVRYVMSMWFTCNEEKKFHDFLDGKVHKTFGSNHEL